MMSFTKLLQSTRFFASSRIASSSLAPFQSANFATLRSVEQKLDLPPKPKKPLTPFFRYMALNRKDALAQNKDLGATGIVQYLAKKWETVDENTKNKLMDEYMSEKEVYTKKIAQYQTKLTEEQKAGIRELKMEVEESREKRAYRKKVRENNKPKKPASGFIRFLAEKFNSKTNERGNLPYREFHKKIVDEWRAMPEEKKTQYNDATRTEMEQYKQELAKWELKMIRLGNQDLVRQEALVEASPDKKPKKQKSKKTKPDSSDSD